MIWLGCSDELDRLDSFATSFVAAASSAESMQMDGVKSFPHGACTVASFVGGELLREAGLGEWTLVNFGTDGGWSFHDWLVRDSLFVDLTAHQFSGYTEPLVGIGQNPLSERFDRLVRPHPLSEIDRWPDAVAWKPVIARLMP